MCFYLDSPLPTEAANNTATEAANNAAAIKALSEEFEEHFSVGSNQPSKPTTTDGKLSAEGNNNFLYRAYFSILIINIFFSEKEKEAVEAKKKQAEKKEARTAVSEDGLQSLMVSMAAKKGVVLTDSDVGSADDGIEEIKYVLQRHGFQGALICLGRDVPPQEIWLDSEDLQATEAADDAELMMEQQVEYFLKH